MREVKYLSHYGTKGMSWYQRNYQSYDVRPTRSGKVGVEYGAAADDYLKDSKLKADKEKVKQIEKDIMRSHNHEEDYKNAEKNIKLSYKDTDLNTLSNKDRKKLLKLYKDSQTFEMLSETFNDLKYDSPEDAVLSDKFSLKEIKTQNKIKDFENEHQLRRKSFKEMAQQIKEAEEAQKKMDAMFKKMEEDEKKKKVVSWNPIKNFTNHWR